MLESYTDGIEEVRNGNDGIGNIHDDNGIYRDLGGRRVANPIDGHIYIHGGQLVVYRNR